MSKSQSLRALVSERLTAAAEEIFILVERTIAEYEEELSRAKEENQRKQQLLEELLKTQQLQHTSGDFQKPFLHSPSIAHPEPLQCKEEAAELSVHLQPSVKNQDHDEAWEPSACSSSASQMKTEADGDNDNGVQMKDSSVLQFNLGPPPGGVSSAPHRHSSGCAECEKHECPFCGKKFAVRQRLKNHLRIHTGEKPFSCTVCHESFTAKGHLKDHMRVHTGEKPYRCSVCDRAFARQFTLQGHMRTHTGERPYSCEECNATFPQRTHLTKHLSSHHGEEHSQCVICQRRFNTRALLVQHMTEVHSGDEQLLTRALLNQHSSL